MLSEDTIFYKYSSLLTSYPKALVPLECCFVKEEEYGEFISTLVLL
jgi:hypothetical protein